MSKLHPKDYESFIDPEGSQERSNDLAHQPLPLKNQQNYESDRPQHYVTRKIKKDQYKITLKETQKSLSHLDQVVSRIIHQPFIEALSEFGAKTVTRPTPIVSGAIVALFGGGAIIYIARHIGFELPSSLFGILFIGGYLLGLVIELFIFIAQRILGNKHD